mgnify:CR=1 FL=1
MENHKYSKVDVNLTQELSSDLDRSTQIVYQETNYNKIAACVIGSLIVCVIIAGITLQSVSNKPQKTLIFLHGAGENAQKYIQMQDFPKSTDVKVVFLQSQIK